jgi:class 3 adenylate cyclase
MSMGSCLACSADLPAGAKFCLECGTPTAQRSCPVCGVLAERGRFCAECGSPLDAGAAVSAPAAAPELPVAERRVTSVLFGDLVGFTPLSESRDAEEVRELLSSYFDRCRVVIGRYGGVVEKFIGDAVMAVWGVPVAHEDDAERAVRAGLELVATVAAMGQDVGASGLAMRVGIVTGEVAVTVGATAEGMVAGDAVNTAARVQAAAEPGHVWVDDTTRSLTAAAILYDDTGEHALKGKAEPARLWQAGAVVPNADGARVDGLEAPLTGRGSDLRLLKDLFHATEESGRPRLVVLDGEAGVGKSRMATEFETYVDGLTAMTRWHRGRCRSYGDGVAFWALNEAVRARLGLVEADTGDIVTERLDAVLEQFVTDEGEREWVRPRLAVLVGVGAGAAFPRDDLFAAWTTFLERLSADDNTVVLVLDDLQHADDSLLDFLDHLLGTGRAPIFVLALARPELLERRSTLGGRRTTVVRLGPLDDTAMATLVDGLVVGLPPSARAALVARAEGIPLFAVETVRALIDRDLVVPRDGRYVPADGVRIDLDAVGAPASLHALVAARLDALAAEEKRLVTDASVLGLTFTREGLIALGADPAGLDDVLAALVRKEILAVDSDRFSAERGQHRFVQSVVRQVAYATQSRHDRKARHIAVAAYLAALDDPAGDLAQVVAKHLLDAIDAAPGADDVPAMADRARDHLERAAARARALGAPIEAQVLLETALVRSDDPATMARLHLSAASAAVDASSPGGLRHARRATELFESLGDSLGAGHAVAAAARLHGQQGENAEAIELAQARWSELEELEGAEAVQLSLAVALASAYGRRGDWIRQATYTERMLLLAELLADPDSLALAHIYMSNRFGHLGATETAGGLLATAARIARAHGLTDRLAHALINHTSLLAARDLAAALENGSEAVEAARRSGEQENIEFALANQAMSLWCAGRLDEAAAALAELASLSIGPLAQASSFATAALLRRARGTAAPEAVDLATDDQVSLAFLAAGEAVVAVDEGRPVDAIAAVERWMTHVPSIVLAEDSHIIWPAMVEVALGAGDLGCAERLLAPVASAPATQVSPALGAQLLRLTGRVGAARGDDPVSVEDHFRRGISALDAFGAVGERAGAQEELGRWLVDQGRPGDAGPLLAAARSTYAEIGALGWLARLDAFADAPVAASS